MKSKTLTCITAMTLFAALAMPVRLAGQQQPVRPEQNEQKHEHQRYKLIDLGTFGGPNSFANGPLVPDLSNSETYAGVAETAIPDPFAPNCQNEDCLVQHAQEWRNGVVTDLGTLPGVNLSSGATWVSGNGTIVGASQNGLIDPLLGIPEIRAVIWTKRGQIIDLGTLGGNESFAAAVNSQRQATGWSLNTIPDLFSFVGGTTQTRAFVWQLGAMQDLGTLGGPDALSQGINERGQIVGISYTNSTANPDTGIPTVDPFLWENGAMVDLGTLGGTVGVADFVNSRGQVVGWSNLAGDQTHHPFLWDRGSLRDLGTFGGSNGQAIWINDGGEVVGEADLVGDSMHHGFLWKRGVMTDLGSVGTDPCSNAFSINSHEQIVGNSTDCHGAALHGFLWENGGPILDLNSLVLPGSDIKVLFPYDINDRGEIAAQGVLPNGDDHAVLLIPCDGNHAETEGCENSGEGTSEVTQSNPAILTQHRTTASPASEALSNQPNAVLERLHARFFGLRTPGPATGLPKGENPKTGSKPTTEQENEPARNQPVHIAYPPYIQHQSYGPFTPTTSNCTRRISQRRAL